MKPNFHLSIGVNSVEESVNFFVRVLAATVLHQDPSGYVNVDLYGNQITLKESLSANANIPDFHFGVNLSLSDFDRVANKISESKYGGIVSAPKVVDAGTVMERKKMYLKCPTGYLIELKGYREEGPS